MMLKLIEYKWPANYQDVDCVLLNEYCHYLSHSMIKASSTSTNSDNKNVES